MVYVCDSRSTWCPMPNDGFVRIELRIFQCWFPMLFRVRYGGGSMAGGSMAGDA